MSGQKIGISKEHAVKLGLVMERIAEAGIDVTRDEAAEHCIDWAYELLTEKGMKVKKIGLRA